MIQAIAAIEPIDVASIAATGPVTASSNIDFSAVLEGHLSQVNTSVATAESMLQKLASGQQVELHDVMISMEQARISVQSLVQIRNRALEVYQDLTRMQV